MIETVKHLIVSQFEASLCTVGHCVARCSDELWNAPVAKYPFCQVAFHTLFFTDYYLCKDEEPSSMRQQPFHLDNPAFFGDYEQLEYREPVSLYKKPQILEYLNFCREKAVATVAAESQADLEAPAKFVRRKCTRAELHVYNMRHIQHHAAQLILRLRLDSDVDIPWIDSGWKIPVLAE